MPRQTRAKSAKVTAQLETLGIALRGGVTGMRELCVRFNHIQDTISWEVRHHRSIHLKFGEVRNLVLYARRLRKLGDPRVPYDIPLMRKGRDSAMRPQRGIVLTVQPGENHLTTRQELDATTEGMISAIRGVVTTLEHAILTKEQILNTRRLSPVQRRQMREELTDLKYFQMKLKGSIEVTEEGGSEEGSEEDSEGPTRQTPTGEN